MVLHIILKALARNLRNHIAQHFIRRIAVSESFAGGHHELLVGQAADESFQRAGVIFRLVPMIIDRVGNA